MNYSIPTFAAILVMATLAAGCDSVTPITESSTVLLEPAEVSAVPRPVRLTFEKTAEDPENPGIWHGEVAGAFSGNLTTVLRDVRVAGPIWHVEFDWIITGTVNGEHDLTARLNGILNTNTWRVVMNGRVIDGYLEGARVHEEGQLMDEETLEFHGIINIMPRTAR
jgi:hypothetical protein